MIMIIIQLGEVLSVFKTHNYAIVFDDNCNSRLRGMIVDCAGVGSLEYASKSRGWLHHTSITFYDYNNRILYTYHVTRS